MKWPWIQAMVLMTSLGAAQHTEQGRALQKLAVDTAKNAVATYELGQLARALERDQVYKPAPTPQRFPDFIRATVTSRDQGRDVTLDPWGQAYWMQLDRTGATLRSAGPDGERMTPDDISVSFHLVD